MEALQLKVTLIVFLPLIGAIIAGFFRHQIGKVGAHLTTIALMVVSSILAFDVFWGFLTNKLSTIETTLYTWGLSGGINFEIGFLIDKLTAIMLMVVTSVSLMVHIYTIGYMKGDPGYQRFFSYISLFTFAMLMLVTSNNFLQLFFGWEAVGLISYLLIGFWYKRESATFASLKAFLVNRVGDFGFILGIAGVLMYFGSMNYLEVFPKVAAFASQNSTIEILNLDLPALSVVCICLFIGAMGKSAQVPLHVWLPDSMEGPTPISALIHAATMVTAGVFMVTRMSPIFEYSEVALNFILVIGSLTCFFMGLLGIVSNDIKRVVAYSTLSQLGYMMVAASVSAYSVAIFHLMTHAFFKALLFLGAGSVIIAMHHEQDIQKMGNLKKYMPITYVTMLIGSLALIGFPGFAGFYSKDLIIEAVANSNLQFANIGYWAVFLSVFVTALYTFRMFFLVFHTKERIEPQAKAHLHESPLVVTIPLILLAIGSVLSGFPFVQDIIQGFFGEGVKVLPQHDVLAPINKEFHGVLGFTMHGFVAKPFWLAMLGVFTAWLCYIKYPCIPTRVIRIFKPIYLVFINKYWFDTFNQKVVAALVRYFGWLCWRVGDRFFLDSVIIHGSANTVGNISKVLKRFQTGYLYHYSFVMIVGVLVFLVWILLG